MTSGCFWYGIIEVCVCIYVCARVCACVCIYVYVGMCMCVYNFRKEGDWDKYLLLMVILNYFKDILDMLWLIEINITNEICFLIYCTTAWPPDSLFCGGRLVAVSAPCPWECGGTGRDMWEAHHAKLRLV